jgi:TRAP-type uncharacterized transport system fused permease subunit
VILYNIICISKWSSWRIQYLSEQGSIDTLYKHMRHSFIHSFMLAFIMIICFYWRKNIHSSMNETWLLYKWLLSLVCIFSLYYYSCTSDHDIKPLFLKKCFQNASLDVVVSTMDYCFCVNSVSAFWNNICSHKTEKVQYYIFTLHICSVIILCILVVCCC